MQQELIAWLLAFLSTMSVVAYVLIITDGLWIRRWAPYVQVFCFCIKLTYGMFNHKGWAVMVGVSLYFLTLLKWKWLEELMYECSVLAVQT